LCALRMLHRGVVRAAHNRGRAGLRILERLISFTTSDACMKAGRTVD
jgi:hypothetical protein